MSAKRHIINRVNAVMDSTLNCPIIFQRALLAREKRGGYKRWNCWWYNRVTREGKGADSNNNYWCCSLSLPRHLKAMVYFTEEVKHVDVWEQKVLSSRTSSLGWTRRRTVRFHVLCAIAIANFKPKEQYCVSFALQRWQWAGASYISASQAPSLWEKIGPATPLNC